MSVTVADGGVGKSTLAIAEGIAIALGLNLLGVAVPVRQDVLYINLEEPAVEIIRRTYAVCQNYGIDPRELNDKFHYQSGLDHPIIAASMERGKIVVADLPAAFDFTFFDVVIVDPFVGCHSVSENDNTAIDRVVKQWAQIAAANSMAVEIVHHVRKPPMGGQVETGVSDARGASALVNAARSVRILNAMSEVESQQGRVGDRRGYFRATDGKSNYQPLGAAEWFHLVPVDLPNGDSVATVERWKMPGVFEGVSTADMMRVRVMAAETDYRNDSQSGDWIGNAVAEVLDIDVVAEKRRIKTLLKAWIANGVLAVECRVDPASRHRRSYVVPGPMPE
ncbi:MAG: hypothetical protein JWP51_2669 [Bradyrhizobium sp.]|nr:hypothetical protein [Bradyrhizobium sp.]